MGSRSRHRGAIAWMAQNPVAANLAMLALLVGGVLVGLRVKQEVFPEFELDLVNVTVPYPGASPEEVEKGILLAVEEQVRGLDGVEKVTSVAREGGGTVTIELILGTDSNKALQDVKAAVDRIVSFPEEAERPVVSLATNRREVISLVVYGDASEHVLRELADEARDGLLADPRITLVELMGVRAPEISIELPQADLRRYGLTLPGVAQRVAASALELPAGGVKTPGGEVLLRTAERRELGREFADLPLVSAPNGAWLRLGDVGDVVDGFEDTDEQAFFNGKPAVMVQVFRIGDQTPIEVADAVREFAEIFRDQLPPGMDVAPWADWSEIYRDRMNLLLRNAFLGLSLVLLLLGLLLELRLAFWVTMGIPISFLGSLLFMPALDVSVNMISLFAFIVTLGMVVDDAIIVGENIFEMRQRGLGRMEAAIRGAREVATPVTFAILTSVAAFSPLLFVPGFMGKIFKVIPIIVIGVLAISLFESLFILPAHTAHLGPLKTRGLMGFINRGQQAVSRTFEWLVRTTYAPVLKAALRHRYLVFAIAVGFLVVTVGLIRGGRIQFRFMPKIDSDVIRANLTMPFGSPVADTRKVQARLVETAGEVLHELGEEADSRGVFGYVGRAVGGRGPHGAGGASGSHLASVWVFLVKSDDRDFTAAEFASGWRERMGDIPGIENLLFDYTTGPGAGADIDIQLSHPEMDILEAASAELAAQLGTFSGVDDIDDGFAKGKPQLDFKLKPVARSFGLTAVDVARQVRGAFYGAEAIRQQRGRDEMRVMVRLPERERRSEYNIETLMLRTPVGGEILLRDAATVDRGHAYTSIQRMDGRRTLDVTASVIPGQANAIEVQRALAKDFLPKLAAHYPGLRFSFEGQSRDLREAMESLGVGYALAMIIIFALIAVPFRSYIQPLVVMSAIPFGMVGAVFGHLALGYQLSLMSMMGIVALSGVVVNDSIVLIDAANRRRRERDQGPFDGIFFAGVRRFRPIVLTSLTTFLGLAPMIFETSVQARFLIPMALSLGFGVLFGTLIILLLVPSLYLMVEDARKFLAWLRQRPVRAPGIAHDAPPVSSSTAEHTGDSQT